MRQTSRAVHAILLASVLATPALSDDPTAPPPPDTEIKRSGQPGETTKPTRSPDEQEQIDMLLAIGYLQGYTGIGRSGVTIHDEPRVLQGFNFYVSGHGPEAVLMDMHGNVLHHWRFAYEDAFDRPPENEANTKWWRRAHLFPNGDLLAIFEGQGLIKIDKDSNLIWASPERAHHDLAVKKNGNIYVLTREAHLLPRYSESEPILEDFLVILDPKGQPRWRLSLLEAFERSAFAHYIQQGMRKTGDLFHTNTVHIVDGWTARDAPKAFAHGTILTSMNALGAIAVLDPNRKEITWVRRTAPTGQHDPSMLPSGRILLFDNRMGKGSSRVIELDPASGEIAWSYEGNEEHPFFSMYLGTARRLLSGNTLITESNGGRAFEVTPEKEIVWEFYNPNRTGENGEYIATLPEVVRLLPSFPVEWASNLGVWKRPKETAREFLERRHRQTSGPGSESEPAVETRTQGRGKTEGAGKTEGPGKKVENAEP